jgi:hypothetical protein
VDLTGWAWLAGAGLAAGVLLLAAGLLPPPPPDLAAALARLTAPPAEPSAPGGTGREWVRRTGGWLAAHTPAAGPLGVPATDLRLLGADPGGFHATRAGLAAAGILGPAVAWAAAAVLGLDVGPGLPVAASLGLAAAGWLGVNAAVRGRAAAARAGFRAGLSGYLDLVALERAGAGSPVEALEAAAEVGDGPVFTRIRARLAHAARAGTSPYTALAGLAEDLGVPEMKDLADITAAAADGAAVYTTLLARSRSLRAAVRADEQAAANAASERLVFPVVLLGVGFLLLLFYPALARLLAAAG